MINLILICVLFILGLFVTFGLLKVVINLLSDILKHIGGLFKNSFIILGLIFVVWVMIKKDSARNMANNFKESLFPTKDEGTYYLQQN